MVFFNILLLFLIVEKIKKREIQKYLCCSLPHFSIYPDYLGGGGTFIEKEKRVTQKF